MPANSSSTFSVYRAKFKSELLDLVAKLGTQDEWEEEVLKGEVERIMESVGKPVEGEEEWVRDTRKAVIDKELEAVLFEITINVADAEDVPYKLLFSILDVILVFSELGYADVTLPLSLISNLQDLLTINGCRELFHYVESRVARLTKDMLPQRGKGPLLLRLLNNLLRRLPKSKAEDVVFSGRILMFLSTVFGLGERSGVNLRGNFNITKTTDLEEKPAGSGVDEEGKKEDAMEVEEGAEADPHPDFYTTFWSLQRFFTNPTPLVMPGATPLTPPNDFSTLKSCLGRTLSEFAEATKKEKELGGGAVGKEKDEAEMMEEDDVLEHYFFPKFLTSRNLLNLEIADPTFRRQILTQMLILFQYLLSCTEAGRAKIAALPPTNTSLQVSFNLPDETEKWITEMKERTLKEMDDMDGGIRFRQVVQLILERDQNWINWKLRSCTPFEKAPLDAARSDTARNKLKGVTRKQKAWMHQLGNPTLSNLWRRNTTTLEGVVADAASAESLDSLARKYRMAKNGLKQKEGAKKALEVADPPPADKVMKLSGLQNDIDVLKVRIDSIQWRALRLAATRHFSVFHKIGVGEFDKLMEALEGERRVKEEKEEKAAMGIVDSDGEGKDGIEGEEGAAKVVVEEPTPEVGEGKKEEEGEKKGEEDARMENAVETTAAPSPKRPRPDEDAEMKDSEAEAPPSKRAKGEEES